MRGKKELLTLLSIIIGLSITAQNNPGDNVGQLTEVTPEIQPQLDAIPALQLSEISALTQLPESADNSQTIFMRPVFAQVSNECAQAAGVGYMFTYEINRLRNLPANSIMYEENWYPTHYTYNFLNGGFGSTTWHYAGWNIIKENGCPNVLTWGGMVVNYTQWMTGYNNYLSSMNNRIESHYSINIGTPEGLEIFKHWLNDHNEGSQTGGLGCFATFPDGFIYDDLPSENLSFEGEPVMSNWEYDDFIFHMMTFVGYNDSIKYDINNDDLFTNDIDINEDGEINMLDWEIGALKLVNSGGEDWPPGVTNPEGYCWMPYRLLPLELSEPSNPDKITPVI